MYNKHKYEVNWNELFVYDETSPSCLRWKVNRYRGPKLSQLFIKAGTPVGSLNVLDGYWHVHVLNKMYNAHNIVWTMFNGCQGVLNIDHKDGDRANTRIDNLKLATHSGNMQNKNIYTTNKSGINGVIRREVKSRHGKGKFNAYWISQWYDGEQKSKAFSISKLGENEAKNKAIEYRQKMIDELNEQGANYTDRHGK